MRNVLHGLIVVAFVVVIWFLSSINDGIHHIERQLESLDNNISEIEIHTSGLEKPSEIMDRRAQQKKTVEHLKRLLNTYN